MQSRKVGSPSPPKFDDPSCNRKAPPGVTNHDCCNELQFRRTVGKKEHNELFSNFISREDHLRRYIGNKRRAEFAARNANPRRGPPLYESVVVALTRGEFAVCRILRLFTFWI